MLAIALGVAGACETFLTAAEMTDRDRAVQFFGSITSSQLGCTVNAAGNVNGDGYGDLAIVALPDTVFLVFGRSAAEWASASFSFSSPITPDASSWIGISGEDNKIGRYGVVAGDFNGDGLGDILLGSDSGQAFCVYGHSGAWSSFEAETVGTSKAGFRILGTTENVHVGNAGDMNGDGIDDLLVTHETASTAYVVFGASGATRSSFSLSSIDGANGFALVDNSFGLGVGGAMGSVGDINGDGLADLAIGSSNAQDNAGRAYILFARNVSESDPWPAHFNLTTELDGMNGFIVDGPSSSVSLGWSVVGAGDVNADGFSDIFACSSNNNGGAWIMFGHPAPWTSPLSATSIDGTNGFHFSQTTGESWGISGGGAGDVNGDGFDDIIVGGLGAYDSSGTTRSGAAAIIFGHNGSWPAEIGRTDAVGSVGFNIDGPKISSYFGYSARGAGDVNGDGLADVIVGAPNYNPGSVSQAGYAALVFGVADDHCAVCSNITDDCLACDDNFFLNSLQCEACSDEHCRSCSTKDICVFCFDGFVLNGTVCEAEPPFVSSSSSSSSSQPPFVSSSSSQPGLVAHSSSSSFSSGKDSSSAAATSVVVIETGSGGSATEVAEEVAQLLGVDVGQISVIEITPGTFEVTVINEEVAQQLVDLVTQCIEEDGEQ